MQPGAFVACPCVQLGYSLAPAGVHDRFHDRETGEIAQWKPHMGSLCKRGATAKATSQRAAKRAKDAAAAAAAAATAASTALPQAAVAPEPVPLAPEQAPAALVPAPASPESASLEPARHDVMHEAASLHHAAAGAVNELGVLAEQLAAFIVQRETTELSCEKGIDMDMSVLEESEFAEAARRRQHLASDQQQKLNEYVLFVLFSLSIVLFILFVALSVLNARNSALPELRVFCAGAGGAAALRHVLLMDLGFCRYSHNIKWIPGPKNTGADKARFEGACTSYMVNEQPSQRVEFAKAFGAIADKDGLASLSTVASRGKAFARPNTVETIGVQGVGAVMVVIGPPGPAFEGSEKEKIKYFVLPSSSLPSCSS